MPRKYIPVAERKEGPSPLDVVTIAIGRHAWSNLARIVASSRLDLLRTTIDFCADCAVISIRASFRLDDLAELPVEKRQRAHTVGVGTEDVPITRHRLEELEEVCSILGVPASTVLDAFVGARLSRLREVVPLHTTVMDVSLFQSLRGACDRALAEHRTVVAEAA